QHPLHSRFRYQIVYTERGVSLYNITSLSETFEYLTQVTDGLLLLHKAGFVHRDLSPGNIIVVNRKAKISDLEFAKARKVADLQSLTEQRMGSSQAIVDTCTGTLNFTAVEVVEGCYMFTLLGMMEQTRTFLYTPLHDYESVWWIATWVIFSCTSNTATDSTATRNRLFMHRASSFKDHTFRRYGSALPEELQPLVKILDDMRKTLCREYIAYEGSFDRSLILDMVPALITHLQDLVEVAKGIGIEPLQEDGGEAVGGGKIESNKGVTGDGAGGWWNSNSPQVVPGFIHNYVE
ncbi:hypothetical protein BDM02DRAFT_3194391, partial [Thelephora ganbajun]